VSLGPRFAGRDASWLHSLGMWRSQRRLAGLLGLAVGAALACTVELPRRLACGDGHVDALAGEECDPGDPESFADGCQRLGLPGAARCDPETCTIRADPEICAICGDGALAPSEDCDGENLRNKKCPSGDDLVTCDATCHYDFAACPACGNGQLDPDEHEECDWNQSAGGLITTVQCTTLAPLSGLGLPYARGEVSAAMCNQSCVLSRLACSYCGNGQLEPSHSDIGVSSDLPVLRPAELCDGDAIDPNALSDFCQGICKLSPDDAPSGLALRCKADCRADCLGFTAEPIQVDPIDEADCCVRGGESCDAKIPCCSGCELVAIETPGGTQYVDRCRSI